MISIRVSQILTSKKEDAEKAKKELDRGVPFQQVVEKYSICPSRKTGGDLGWGQEKNLIFLIGENITKDDKGRIIGPIPSEKGYHIVMVTDLKEQEIMLMEMFKKDSHMTEVINVFPDSHSLLFNKFNIIRPPQGYGPLDTLDSVCWAYGKEVTEVLEILNLEYAKKRSTISPEELDFKMKGQADRLIILDIREQWEVDISKINGSQHITSSNNEQTLKSLGKGKEIVLIDWKEERSPSFQKWLTQWGFLNVKTLEGGIDAWSEKVDTKLSRYTLDQDDGYRYEDIVDH